MNLKLQETAIPEEMKILMRTEAIYDWDPNNTSEMIQIIFVAISRYLGLMKSKENGAVALVVNDYKGNLLMAAIVRYTPNDDNPNMPGNWNLSYTLDPADLEDVPAKHYSEDQSFHKVLVDVGRETGWQFVSTMFLEDATKFAIRLIKENLDKNAKPDEEVDIELPEIFIARVAVENDVKVMSIEPGSKTKQLIKGDASIEV